MNFQRTSLSFIFLVSSFGLSSHAMEARSTCTPFGAAELPFERDYRILNSKADIEQDAVTAYQGDRRLLGRAYWDQNMKRYVIPYSSGVAAVPENFIQGLGAHFTKALQNGYVDAIIYPDMGHAHLQLPNQEWLQLKSENESSLVRMEKLLAAANLKALYHTAEMVQIKEGDFAKGRMPQDPWKLWRYFSRNILGAFDRGFGMEILWAGPKAIYNTVREIPDMTEISTVYFVANKDGCFAFKSPEGEKFFDVTFETIPYKKQP